MKSNIFWIVSGMSLIIMAMAVAGTIGFNHGVDYQYEQDKEVIIKTKKAYYKGCGNDD